MFSRIAAALALSAAALPALAGTPGLDAREQNQRERIDRTRRVPENRRFYAIGQAIGAGEGSRFDDGFQALGGIYLRDLSFSRIDGVIREIMAAHACDGDLIGRLESIFIEYSALRS